jgi:hypothetical protein
MEKSRNGWIFHTHFKNKTPTLLWQAKKILMCHLRDRTDVPGASFVIKYSTQRSLLSGAFHGISPSYQVSRLNAIKWFVLGLFDCKSAEIMIPIKFHTQ